jgi:hypothetical protein
MVIRHHVFRFALTPDGVATRSGVVVYAARDGRFLVASIL